MPQGSLYEQIDAGVVPDPSKATRITGTTTLKKNQRFLLITTGASVAYTITVPPLGEWANQEIIGYVDVDGGTGDVTIADPAGNDILGDALSAAADYFIIRNVAGRIVVVTKEVTT